MRRDQRGLSSSVQVTLLFPVVLGIFLLGLQWAMVSWAQATVQTAAEDGARIAAALGSDDTSGHAAARAATDNGALESVDISVTRQGVHATATVRGSAYGVLPLVPVEVEATAVVAVEALR